MQRSQIEVMSDSIRGSRWVGVDGRNEVNGTVSIHQTKNKKKERNLTPLCWDVRRGWRKVRYSRRDRGSWAMKSGYVVVGGMKKVEK